MPARKQLLQERARLMVHHPDTTPVELHVDARPPSLREELQRYIREQVSQMAADNDLGTFEDEDDFEDDDGYEDPYSPYEMSEMQADAPISQPELETLDGTDDSPPPEATPPEPVETSPEPSGSA